MAHERAFAGTAADSGQAASGALGGHPDRFHGVLVNLCHQQPGTAALPDAQRVQHPADDRAELLGIHPARGLATVPRYGASGRPDRLLALRLDRRAARRLPCARAHRRRCLPGRRRRTSDFRRWGRAGGGSICRMGGSSRARPCRSRCTCGASEKLATDLPLFVQLLDENGQAIGNVTTHPGWGRNPTSLWEPGALYEDRYAVTISEPVDDTFSAPRRGLRRLHAAGCETPFAGAAALTARRLPAWSATWK